MFTNINEHIPVYHTAEKLMNIKLAPKKLTVRHKLRKPLRIVKSNPLLVTGLSIKVSLNIKGLKNNTNEMKYICLPC